MEVELLINQEKTGKKIVWEKRQKEDGKLNTENKRVEMCHNRFKWVGFTYGETDYQFEFQKIHFCAIQKRERTQSDSGRLRIKAWENRYPANPSVESKMAILTSEKTEFNIHSIVTGRKKVTTKVKRIVYKEHKNNLNCSCNNKI